MADRSVRLRGAAAAVAALILAGAGGACSRLPRTGRPDSVTGLASWYGTEFHGRTTSSREIYDMNDLTAAHRTLPFGTYVMVTNLENGRAVVVRINDRGPFVRGRVIDLSYAAARVLGLVGPGTARVRLVRLKGFMGPAGTERRGVVWIQVGAYTVQETAYAVKKRLDPSYRDVTVTAVKTGSGTFYRVRVRTDEGEAPSLARRLAGEGYPVIIVRE